MLFYDNKVGKESYIYMAGNSGNLKKTCVSYHRGSTGLMQTISFYGWSQSQSDFGGLSSRCTGWLSFTHSTLPVGKRTS